MAVWFGADGRLRMAGSQWKYEANVGGGGRGLPPIMLVLAEILKRAWLST